MKRFSVKDINGILPPNSLETDFRAELFVALMHEAGIDVDDIVIQRTSNHLSRISKSIDSVNHREKFSTTATSYVEVRVNRNSIYDSMSEGVFHNAVFPNRVKDRTTILEEIKQHNNEEVFIRRFFSLFENEIEQQAAELQLKELQYDKKNSYRNFVNIFSPYWPFIDTMPTRNALLLIKMIPHIHSIRNSFEASGRAMSLILDVPLRVIPIHRPRVIPVAKHTRMSNMRLGVDSVCVGTFSDAEKDLQIHIGDVTGSQAEQFLPESLFYNILTSLTELFLGADKEYEIKISVHPEERKAYLNSLDSPNKSYLGVNAYL